MDWIVDWVIAVFVGSGCCSGLKEDLFSIFLDFGPWTLRNAIADQEQVNKGLQAEGAKQGPVLVGTFFSHKHQQWSAYQTSVQSELDRSRNTHEGSALGD